MGQRGIGARRRFQEPLVFELFLSHCMARVSA